MQGQYPQAIEHYKKANEIREEMGDEQGLAVGYGNLGIVYLSQGDLDRAMMLLRDAYARGRMFTVVLHMDMNLEPLHGYPQFEEFVRPRG